MKQIREVDEDRVAITRHGRWRRVVFSSECDDDGNCPVCGIDYADCGCPGPTMDEYEYREINGVLWARERE